MSLMPAPPLIITPGEPAGIGTEISLKAWQAGIKNIEFQRAYHHNALDRPGVRNELLV